MHSETNDRHQTFIIVVAWLFTLIGAYTAFKTLARMVLTVWNLPSNPFLTAQVAMYASEVAFSVGALMIGRAMLNRRTTALKNAILLVWLYFVWHIGVIAFGLYGFWMQSSRVASLSPETSDVFQQSLRSSLGYFTYATVLSVLTCAICFWLARRLSLPIIKNAYSSY